MQDITDTLQDINPTDRVFKTEDGRFVKVRIVRVQPPPGSPSFGVAHFSFSGSECGPDGKALPLRNGHRVGPAEVHTIQSDVSVDVQAVLAALCVECVEKTVRAAQLEDALSPGASMIGSENENLRLTN